MRSARGRETSGRRASRPAAQPVDLQNGRTAEETERGTSGTPDRLEQRQALLESVIDALADAVMISDERITGVVVNPAYRTLYRLDLDPDFFRRPAAERARRYQYRDLTDHPVPPEDWPAARALRGEVIAGASALEARMTALDGSTVEVSLTAAPIRDPSGRITGTVTVARDIRGQRTAEAERERLLAERQLLLVQIVEAQEEERRRVAHEVHDAIVQAAAAAALRLDQAVDLLQENPEQALPDVERGRDLARRVVDEARRLIGRLRPETLDVLGLEGALQQEVEAYRAAGGRADLEDGGLAGVRLAPEAEITLFRVAQEALANARKHTQGARVRIRLRRKDGEMRLEVRDWGGGFDPAEARTTARGEAVGLIGMRERMALLGGRLELNSSPENGTTIRAILPIEHPTAT